MTLFVILIMIVMHTLADYGVQHWCRLSDLKQKAFWETHPVGREKKYQYDYLFALGFHSINWACLTFWPLLFFHLISMEQIEIYNIVVIVNAVIHAIIDDLKANKLKLNLGQDQTLHLLQIVISTYIITFII